ncbi:MULTISPECIES: ATPase, T2SS/T4P/T4SS family [Thermobacillus]|uniref:Type II secretory pathway, ATPase PulE/Tfp pilus assembly pathway, ATPase PilB n=1 Tax=Thermobacillus composti (strain DSM 18247 / JCM 13945 / KWC4) TaxID=717605 RepID=L0EKU4_THECK|nr:MULTISPECIES: ATPase, T2SS/T4P/T4SS family [Thermobacillus]AGA59890.1 type II secretory pathway, ATPase PulE/Tfp pilus assembly pathway, ATPase PilB [Thermobacillus composti KWC4]
MRLGELLIQAGLITEEQLQEALREGKERNMRLGDVLIAMGYITEQQRIEVLEFQLGIPHVQLYRENIDPRAIQMVPRMLAETHKVLPYRIEGNKLIVAMSDPLDYYAIEELRMATGMWIEPAIVSSEELDHAIRRYYGLQESVDQVMQDLAVREAGTRDEEPEEEEDSPVARTVNQIIQQAVLIGASDIHFDPQADALLIRYRVDGVMRTERTLPPNMQGVIAARIKVMSGLNVAERRLPQDGRVEMNIAGRKIDIRISTLPTIHGEKIVMRILDLSQSLMELEQLGFSPHNLELFRKGIASSYGIVFITGPTGSGKTTTLYSALARLNREDVNIMTIEDPVEYRMRGINQIQVNPRTELTFARGLRAILRQDPNIVMVGEIRDVETAEIAVRAAMTGHLVLSTLHSNSSVNAITRLIDMGVEPFLVASALRCVVAQRLVRKVCRYCAAERAPSGREAELLAAAGIRADKLLIGAGCAECLRTGYRGRLAIHEVLFCDDGLRNLILRKRADNEYRDHASRHGGLIPILHDGLAKAAAGLTTVSEVLRVVDEG